MLVLVRNLSDLFMLVLVRIFLDIPLASFTDELYTPDANFSDEFFFYTLDASFSEEFHCRCWFYRGDTLTLLILV